MWHSSFENLFNSSLKPCDHTCCLFTTFLLVLFGPSDGSCSVPVPLGSSQWGVGRPGGWGGGGPGRSGGSEQLRFLSRSEGENLQQTVVLLWRQTEECDGAADTERLSAAPGVTSRTQRPGPQGHHDPQQGHLSTGWLWRCWRTINHSRCLIGRSVCFMFRANKKWTERKQEVGGTTINISTFSRKSWACLN